MGDDLPPDDHGFAVPSGRAARFVQFGRIASGIVGGVAAGGLRALASGKRPDLAELLLTPANTLRLTDGLSQLRGAALKLGQMLSMDAGQVWPDDLTAILARMRDDARHVPPKQLQNTLNAEWRPGWYGRFARFDVRPFAAASIGQVHRAVTRDGQDLAIKVQYPGVRASIDSDVNNMATIAFNEQINSASTYAGFTLTKTFMTNHDWPTPWTTAQSVEPDYGSNSARHGWAF